MPNLERLTIIEIGAGTGLLASDILAALVDEQGISPTKIDYLICERSPTMVAAAQTQLQDCAVKVVWVDEEMLLAEPRVAIVLANEVVDALAVHRVKWQGKRLWESYIGVKGEQLFEVWQTASTPLLEDFLQRLEVRLAKGQIVEISLDAIAWLEKMARIIPAGFLITIDYGDLVDHLYNVDRLEGTLRCFYQHTINDQFLVRLGEQDITAEVNFSSLIEYGKDFGLSVLKFSRQADFLIQLGLLDRIEQLMINTPTINNLKTRLALKNFFVPGGISDHFKVLVQERVKTQKRA